MRFHAALRGTATSVILLLLTIALAELAASVLLCCSITTLPSRSEIQATLDAPLGSVPVPRPRRDSPHPEFLRQHVLHPFLGFVRNPDIDRHVFSSRAVAEPVNEHGFFGPSPLAQDASGTIDVVITGGSVATDLYLRSSEAFRRGLAKSPLLADERIRIFSLALGGMKQPQQLLALQYFLSLGASFDAVVNLDGFNDIALPPAENVPAGLPVSAPRSWQLYTAEVSDDQSVILLARTWEERWRIERARTFFSREPLRRSGLCLIIWHGLHGRLRSELFALEERLRVLLRHSRAGDHPSANRPLQQILVEAAELWARSSIQMWKTCQSNGIVYLHVLQPNRYVAGSKPLDARERRLAWPPQSAHRRAAEQGYPLLISEGEKLARLGVPFRDLTRVFETERERIYVDACCHFNQRGNDLLAAEIASLLAASIEAAEPSRSRGRGDSEASPAP